jgi:dynein heavy chain
MATDEIRESIVNFMPYSFKVVGKQAEKLYEEERREVHATPKSFLELIKLFKSMQS